MPKRKQPPKSKTPAPKRQKTFPFARGFKLPTERQCLRAIGPGPLEPEYEPADSFPPVPKPVSDLDWLAETAEEGQSYNEFLRYSSWHTKSNQLKLGTCDFDPSGTNVPEKYSNGKIYLLPLGAFGNALDLEEVARYTKLFYKLPVVVLDKIPTKIKNRKVVATKKSGEEVILTTRYHAGTGHYQCRVDSGLNELHSDVPTDRLFVIIITLIDLYCDETDLFVAGIGSIWRKMGIFSFNRYDPALKFSEEHWFERQVQELDMSPASRKTLLLERCCKLLVHEIAHIFGLGHCVYYSCVMNGSGNLQEDFRQPHHFCPVDLHKIKTLCGFHVVERYQGLAEYYRDHGMTAEHEWVTKRLATIADLRMEFDESRPEPTNYVSRLRPK